MKEKVNVLVRFPNESEPIKFPIYPDDFVVTNIFDKEVFGDYQGTHIAIKREDYEKNIL